MKLFPLAIAFNEGITGSSGLDWYRLYRIVQVLKEFALYHIVYMVLCIDMICNLSSTYYINSII